ncbi:hypothetical protein ACSVH2_04460 [Flavobacterium sp. RSB2_4_14]|uniref:hypothetical protein n=1 Tax=Flavobacterium sp. RSB2_4_14 TaxID=3447665 RepID=UPI003F375A04
MKNFTLYIALLACLLASKLSAQDTFEAKAKAIAEKIESITKEEKAALKLEIESVNKELEAGTITNEQADEKKLKFAETRSKNIETRVAVEQQKLEELVNQKVEGKIKEEEFKPNTFEVFFSKSSGKNKEKYQKRRDSIARTSERRTTSQFVFAMGVNNLVTDGAVANSDYKYWGSHFYEWGVTGNTRIFKNDNLLHLKYGVSLMYNNLRPTDNRVFVANGSQTDLVEFQYNLDDSRFRNVFITAPLHLEFDFTKAKNDDGKTIFRTHKSVRFGIGGYGGFRLKSKQKLCFEVDGNNVDTKEKGDFNVNDFIYGLSTYIGYKQTSLYLKYDLNPLFKDNAIDQNNISLGVRFDFN